MVQIIDGKIVQYSLPETGWLKDGSSVSGYHLLDIDILLAEGWLPLEDIRPEYDAENQYLMNDGYEILEDKVIRKYIVENIPKYEEVPQTPSDIEVVEKRQEIIEDTMMYILTL